MLRLSLLAQLAVCDFERGSCRKHGVCQDQGFALQVRCAGVLDVYMKSFPLVILPVCSYECVLCIIEIVQDALVQRQACTENGSYDNLVIMCAHICDSEWSGHGFLGVFQSLTYLVCEYFSQPFKVSAESHAVFLDLLVTHL